MMFREWDNWICSPKLNLKPQSWAMPVGPYTCSARRVLLMLAVVIHKGE